jgi:GH24 family phage-related lysozyme (muramidase)
VANAAPITLDQLFRYWRDMPHQRASIAELEADIIENGYEVAMRRNRPWFNTWSQDGKQANLGPALELIREFEGCHLEAYPDPLSGGAPWTIGYGTTRYSDGRPVKQGDKISAVEADMLLRQEVDRIAAKLRATVPFWMAMADEQKCALISFAYNLGTGFYGNQGFGTISTALREKRWGDVPAAMLLYRNPGTAVEAGLRRRRLAEGALWANREEKPAVAASKLTPGSPFSFKVTPHFTYGELCNNEEKRRFLNQGQCDIATELCEFLEKARTHFGAPVVITSGHRPPAVNAAVGGASNSEHLYKPGCGAVDFFIDGVDIYAVQRWCDKAWPYSLGYGAPKGFVHLGIRDGRPRVRWDY